MVIILHATGQPKESVLDKMIIQVRPLSLRHSTWCPPRLCHCLHTRAQPYIGRCSGPPPSNPKVWMPVCWARWTNLITDNLITGAAIHSISLHEEMVGLQSFLTRLHISGVKCTKSWGPFGGPLALCAHLQELWSHLSCHQACDVHLRHPLSCSSFDLNHS